MINTMFSRLAPAVLLLAVVSPALAGEVGVTNSFSHSAREGKGTSVTQVLSLRLETGNATNSAFKAEVGQLPPASPQGPSSGTYFATSSASGSSNYAETRIGTCRDSKKYDFSDASGSHTVSSFAN